MRKIQFIFLCLLLTLTSCRTVYVFFEKETPDITPNDDKFYNGAKTFTIKSTNQTVVYNSNELSSNINVLINSMEKQFVTNNLKIVKDNADVVIEVISIDVPDYSTNTVYKPNGKKKTYNCSFKFNGLRVFLKATRGDNSVNYTFYETPCSTGDGCPYTIDRACKLTPVGNTEVDNSSYTVTAKDNPSGVERLGRKVSKMIISRIQESK